MPNKISEISALAIEQAIQIFCITETHLNSEVYDAEVSLPNYNIFREDREGINSKGGGSAIFVKNDFVA